MHMHYGFSASALLGAALFAVAAFGQAPPEAPPGESPPPAPRPAKAGKKATPRMPPADEEAVGKVLKMPSKEEKVPGKEDSPDVPEMKELAEKEMTEAETETPLQIYSRVLATDPNPLVRRRAALALRNLQRAGQDASEALPALLLALSPAEERNESVRAAAEQAVLQFKAVEVAEALQKAIRDPQQPAAGRRIGCKALANYIFHRSLGRDLRQSVYLALEEALLDQEPEVRLAAATALEAIDRKSQQVVQAELNVKALKLLRLTPEKVLQTVEEQLPGAELLPDGATIEWSPEEVWDARWVQDIRDIPVYKRPTRTFVLRDLAKVTEKTPKRKVLIRLDTDGLSRIRVAPKSVVAALQAAYPQAEVNLTANGRQIEWAPASAEDATLVTDLGKLAVYQRPEGSILLRDVATFSEVVARPSRADRPE